MSGGHFDYQQYRIDDIADSIEHAILNNNIPDDYGFTHALSDETIKSFKKAVAILRVSGIYAQRADWLLSGDDGEESYHRRLKEDLAGLKDVSSNFDR